MTWKDYISTDLGVDIKLFLEHRQTSAHRQTQLNNNNNNQICIAPYNKVVTSEALESPTATSAVRHRLCSSHAQAQLVMIQYPSLQFVVDLMWDLSSSRWGGQIRYDTIRDAILTCAQSRHGSVVMGQWVKWVSFCWTGHMGHGSMHIHPWPTCIFTGSMHLSQLSLLGTIRQTVFGWSNYDVIKLGERASERTRRALLKMRMYAAIMTRNGATTPSPITAVAYEYDVRHRGRSLRSMTALSAV